jgi:hypothetical protein
MEVVNQARSMLTGTALLAHTDAILADGGSKAYAARSAGYVTTKANGSERILYTDYYTQLLYAQGKLSKIRVTITDTFGGEPNYSWVNLHTIYVRNDKDPVRYIKRQIGYTGVKCDREEWGGSVILRPRGQCIIIMMNWV